MTTHPMDDAAAIAAWGDEPMDPIPIVEVDPTDALRQLGRYVAHLRNLEQMLERHTKRVAELGTEINRLKTQSIPDLIAGAGLGEKTRLALEDGSYVSLQDVVVVPSMSRDSDKREPMLNWLEENGLADVIRDQITVPLAAGQSETADRIIRALELEGVGWERYRTVNPQTLKSTMREVLEVGKLEIPAELGVQRLKVAKVTESRKK